MKYPTTKSPGLPHALRRALSGFLGASALLAAAGASAQLTNFFPYGNAFGNGGPDPTNGREVGFTEDGPGAYTITSAGQDIWGSSDHGSVLLPNFTIAGNFDATVRNVSINRRNNTWGRTGLMARANTNANSAHVMLARKTPNNNTEPGIVMQWRDSNGGNTGRNDGDGNAILMTNNGSTLPHESTPFWMRLRRDGDTYFASIAPDDNGAPGVWTGEQMHPANGASGPVFVGLAHQSHGGGNAAPNTAVFDNLSILHAVAAVDVDVQGRIVGRAYDAENGEPVGPADWTVTVNTFTTNPDPEPGILYEHFQGIGNLASRDNLVGQINGGLAANPAPFLAPNIGWGGSDGAFDGDGMPRYFPDVDAAHPGGREGNGSLRDYMVRMTGEICIPESGTYRFKDGVDDYTYLAIDGEVLINDNAWTGANGSQNGGSPIVTKTFENIPEGGQYFDIEFVMGEGGGGDSGILFWDYDPAAAEGARLGTNAAFPAANDQPAGFGAVVPGEFYQAPPPQTPAEVTSLSGTGIVGSSSVLGAFSGPLGDPYSQNFGVSVLVDPVADGTTDLGDGSTIGSNDGTASVQGNRLQLTLDGVNSTRASFRTPAVPGSAGGWVATFDFELGDSVGSNPPADGFSFNYGAIPAYDPAANAAGATGNGGAEEGFGIGLSVEVDTWQVGDAEHGYNVAVDGVDVPGGTINTDVIIDGQTITGTATISWDPVIGVTFVADVDGLGPQTIFDGVATPGFSGDDSFIFAFSARTGGANETVIIDNLNIQPIGALPVPARPDDQTYTATVTATGADGRVETVTGFLVTARDDSYATDEDSVLEGNVLGNDGPGFSVVSSDTSGVQGDITVNADGSFTYDPTGAHQGLAAGESLVETFTYSTEESPIANSNSATVTITVSGNNDAPVAGDDTISGTAGAGTALTADDLTANDSDVDGDPLAVRVDLSGSLGTFETTAAVGGLRARIYEIAVQDGGAGNREALLNLDGDGSIRLERDFQPNFSVLAPWPDFGTGTEGAPGDGSVLNRGGSGGNIFGGLGVGARANDVALVLSGWINIESDGNFRFTTRSDDGSVLDIDSDGDGSFAGNRVVENNFFQGMTNRSGDVFLAAGSYRIRAGWYEGGGGAGCQVSWEKLDGDNPFGRRIIAPAVLFPDTDEFDDQLTLVEGIYTGPGAPSVNIMSLGSATEVTAGGTDNVSFVFAAQNTGDTWVNGLVVDTSFAYPSQGASFSYSRPGLAPGPVGAAGGWYRQDFNLADGATDLGDGSVVGSSDGVASVQGGALRLTADANTGTRSSWRLPTNIDGSGGFDVWFDFDMFDAAGANPPADGFSFNYGAIPADVNNHGGAEEGFGTGISFEVDTWNVNDAEHGYNIAVDNVDVAAQNVSHIVDGQSRSASARFSWDPNSGASMWIDGAAIFQNVPTPGFNPSASDTFAFSARTGGATEDLLIDNFRLSANRVANRRWVIGDMAPGEIRFLNAVLSVGGSAPAVAVSATATVGSITDSFSYDVTDTSGASDQADVLVIVDTSAVGDSDGSSIGIVRAPVVDPTSADSDFARSLSGNFPGEFTNGVGDPATVDTVWGPRADPDGDGAPNWLEFALVSDPNDAGSLPTTTVEVVQVGGVDFLQLCFNRPINRGGVSYVVEVTNDGQVWLPGFDFVRQWGASVDNGDGTEWVCFRPIDPMGDAQLMRVRVFFRGVKGRN